MRNIFVVNATQVVVSESHPEGLYSTVNGYPKTFDSRAYAADDGNPNGDVSAALRAAKSEYFSRLSANYGGMIRSGYANIRDCLTSNDAKCSAGTILKIYIVDV